MPEKPGSILVEGQGHNINMSDFLETYAYRNYREDRNLGLEVSQGQTLGLVGGDIFLRGGNLTSDGGRVELGSVQNGVVEITTDRTLSYDKNLEFGQIILSEASSIDISGNGRVEFQIQGEEINVQDNSLILGKILGDEDGGNSIIRASKSIKIGPTKPFEKIPVKIKIANFIQTFNKTMSFIFLNTYGKGDVGELRVKTESLTLQDGALIYTGTLGDGDAGNLTVSARDIEINGGGYLTGFFPTTLAEGNGGNLTVEVAESLTLQDGAFMSTATTSGDGNAGNLTVSARGIEMSGFVVVTTTTETTGNGGNLTVKAAESLTLQDGAIITTTTYGEGNAGNLTVSARDILSGYSTILSAETLGQGKGGNLTVKAAESLTLQDGAFISTKTSGDGDAGNLRLSARDIEIIGKSPDGEFLSSRLSAEATNG
ncbi:filamentous hemagglutinin, partial [Trichodesmium erythraeum 21-75]|nr:filamentous hemagglutinin [Trichodesmium erythraeum 21-75]